jgi:hypothetical protein
MKSSTNPGINELSIKKEWNSPELSELPVEETNQLPPPSQVS